MFKSKLGKFASACTKLNTVPKCASFSSFNGEKNERGNYVVTLFPGHGIGPEISKAVISVFRQAQVPIEWEEYEVHMQPIDDSGKLISEEALNSVRRNKIGLKGPMMTPIGKGYRSINVTLRKDLNLYANVRPCKTIKGVKCRYTNVDLVTIRENTEGEYSGLEHEVAPGVMENLKIISKKACRRIAEYAFEYAQQHGRKKVTACHKATIMKLGDGLFLDQCREVSKEFPDILYSEKQVDTMAMLITRNPLAVDVMVMPNLYGDIISDLCAGLIGGLGITPSGNIGEDAAVFEAVHGTAPDIAGRNLANPTALLLSSVMMLNHMGLRDHAQRIETSIFKTLDEQECITGDLGGRATTDEYADAIVRNLREMTF